MKLNGDKPSRAIAVAPLPPPPEIVTVGAEEYRFVPLFMAPKFVGHTPRRATAVAVTPLLWVGKDPLTGNP